ncbi:MAG: metallophosphoesterase [Flavobacteriales bacterium]|nr:metallophosphoesterase [Flavobacteriales bacterium]
MRLVIFILLLIFIEVYAFKGLRMMTLSCDPLWRKLVLWFFALTTICSFGFFFLMISNMSYFLEVRTYHIFNFVIGLLFTCLIVKCVFAVFHLADDVTHWIRLLVQALKSKPVEDGGAKISRIQFFNYTGMAVSGLMLGSILYGMLRGKYNFRVLTEKISFPDLPKAFDGLRIVHISDLHLGSFNETFDEVQKGFDLINELDADYIFFTGDMINNFSDEAEPWIERLRNLKAKHGKFSILGNHDYGDYALGDYPDLKAKSIARLAEIYAECDFRLLRNENVVLERNGERITLLGSENWGRGGFSKYGDLKKTMDGVAPDNFKILLSHDPTHWEREVLGKEKIQLTLSGHTHGAQIGVEVPALGIKFSPSTWIGYKRWGGHYTEGDQHLYVNRGFGFLAFPTRAGIPPEITLIELKAMI